MISRGESLMRHSIRSWPDRRRSLWHVLTTAVVLGGVVAGPGAARQADAGTLAWSPANIPSTFLNLDCPVPGFCVAVKERQTDYKVTGDALIGTYSDGVWRATNLPLKGLNPPAATSPEVQVTGLSCAARVDAC